ncbi:hypothetical protein GUJ93_ZPchr0007g3128 [Zizania palustris]|uniref:Uncharacterized protein n=1 Tax=Zizania palustris TaxID=103762 RepID=A0A8J5T3E8_ZIZPA|nr:hypothetical protein GUJ93_ZPchr0007g3128 [Zizania palustris]
MCVPCWSCAHTGRTVAPGHAPAPGRCAPRQRAVPRAPTAQVPGLLAAHPRRDWPPHLAPIECRVASVPNICSRALQLAASPLALSSRVASTARMQSQPCLFAFLDTT